MKKSGTIMLAAIAALGMSTISTEASARTETERGSLSSTGVDDNAFGEVKLKVRNSSDGRFDMDARKLAARTTYDVLANGVLVGRFTTTGKGRGRIHFRSRRRTSKDVLLGFDPRGSLVVVRDDSGRDVLAVALANTGSVSGGNVICCIPDDRGPECEDRTPAECTAQGGTASTATSCLPNPCAGGAAPKGGHVVCCIPDDSGPECEDRTADQCAVQGGVVVQAATCVPNPCATAVPPADGDIQCCVADDSGPKCEDRTPAACAVEGGVNAGAGTCTPNPCASLPPPSASATVIVQCEQRANRSKISVDGNNLAVASYQARAISGGNTAIAPARPTIGDELQVDFDSDGGDIAAGATAIPAAFIQGTPPQVTGAILTVGGDVVVEATVNCVVK
jgi:hypothetical protein